MSLHDKAPYLRQDPREINILINGLQAGAAKGKSAGFRCRATEFTIDGTDGLTLNSWKFMDWDYKRDDLPTYARGLFTTKNSKGQAEIVTRGYDKFFNIEEVNDTKWRNIEENTRGPYELSVKENGCIVFLSGLENGKLLVCSKHSTGARADAAHSHAVVGEKWVDRHLASIGKSKTELARELRARNVTAVAELCDDSFEEHVLAYEEKNSGLYLHGINLNVPEFATYSGAQVHKFADTWGFKKAQYLVKDGIQETQNFLEKCAETGSYDGRDTEGFVIRCQKKVGNSHVDWFFKYKFDEPYLMYRQWREATKAVIAGKAPKYKKHTKITEEYLLFARRQLAQNPGLAKAYQQNHGIIKMREDFLKALGVKGSDIIRQEYEEDGGNPSEHVDNIVLVPVATIGCGKTTVALALTQLFGWGHVQNDNITQKKNRPQAFTTQITNALSNKPVVIADRNNHQRRERAQLTSDLMRVLPGVKLVALHYVHHPKHEKIPMIRRVTQERVFSRGDNHQTIQASTKKEEVKGIMEGFLGRFDPIEPDSSPDNAFDEVIDLDVVKDSRHNLELVVTRLREIFPKLIPEAPTPDDLDAAIDAALNGYTVGLKHDLSFRNEKKQKDPQNKGSLNGSQAQPSGLGTNTNKQRSQGPSYFSLQLPSSPVRTLLDKLFTPLPAEAKNFYTQLANSRRIQPAFHVTLVHRASIRDHPALWNRYLTEYNLASVEQSTTNPLLGKCRVRLDRVIWDGRVMCFVARMLDERWESMAKQRGGAVHVTIGTADQSIKPKESNDLVHRWENGEACGEMDIDNGEEFFGEVRAVFQ